MSSEPHDTDVELEIDLLDSLDRIADLANPCDARALAAELKLAWYAGYRRGLAFARNVYRTPGERT